MRNRVHHTNERRNTSRNSNKQSTSHSRTQRDELQVNQPIPRTKGPAHIKNVTQTTHNQIDERTDDQKFNKLYFSVQFWIGLFRLSFFFDKKMFNNISSSSFYNFISADVLLMDITNPIVCLDRRSQLLLRTNSRRSSFVKGSR